MSPLKRISSRAPRVTLVYDGWQVWDGQYGPVRVGGDFRASLEFVQRSALRPAGPAAQLRLEHTDTNWYRASAKVLDSRDAVVLDFGSVRALRWVRPGESPGDFATGATVSLELSLSLNGWEGSPWTTRAAQQHGTDHLWHVERILRKSKRTDESTEIDEAAMETVDSAYEYCLLQCVLLE